MICAAQLCFPVFTGKCIQAFSCPPLAAVGSGSHLEEHYTTVSFLYAAAWHATLSCSICAAVSNLTEGMLVADAIAKSFLDASVKKILETESFVFQGALCGQTWFSNYLSTASNSVVALHYILWDLQPSSHKGHLGTV